MTNPNSHFATNYATSSHGNRIQWDLFIKDTLGPANLFTVERLSTIQRWKCINTIGESMFGVLESVLCRELISMVSYNRCSTVTSEQHSLSPVWTITEDLSPSPMEVRAAISTM